MKFIEQEQLKEADVMSPALQYALGSDSEVLLKGNNTIGFISYLIKNKFVVKNTTYRGKTYTVVFELEKSSSPFISPYAGDYFEISINDSNFTFTFQALKDKIKVKKENGYTISLFDINGGVLILEGVTFKK